MSIHASDAKILGYANLISTQTQTTTANTPTAVRLETTSMMHPAIRLVDQTKIYIDNSGPYNLQFSFQVVSTNNSTQSIEVWIRYNGVDYPWTNTQVDVNKGASVAAWNIFGESVAGGYVQIMWKSTSSDVTLYARPADTTPGIPSAIVTLSRLHTA